MIKGKTKSQSQTGQIKVLHKKFKFLDKPDIKLIHQFCDEKIEKTQKILVMAMGMPNPKYIIKILNEKPEKASTLLAELERRYDKIHINKNKQATQQASMEANNNTFNFFKYVPPQACLSIIKFLDPHSFFKFSLTCKSINSIANGEACSEYFRILCVNLFEKIEPQMPQNIRFLQVRKYVLDHAHQFGPNTRGVVMNKLRYYIWQEHISLQKKASSYYQQFGSYKKIFLKCPRVHFNGYYVCKHQYRKQQTNKDIINTSIPVHLVSYYRYLRFFEDGSVISAVFPAKAKEYQIIQLLSAKTFDKELDDIEAMSEVMIGQYYVQQNKVNVKIVKSSSIFNYQLQIGNQSNDTAYAFNRLTVLKYWLRVVDQKQIIQVLEEYNQKKNLEFIYKTNSVIKKQNSWVVRSSSL